MNFLLITANISIAGNENIRNNNNIKYDTKTESGQHLNSGEDDQMEIQGFVRNKIKTCTVRTFYVLTLGILRLVFHWYPHWEIKATHSRCSLRDAEKVLIIDTYKKFRSYFVKEIKILSTNTNSINGIQVPEFDTEDEKKKLLDFNLSDGRKKQLYQARIIKCKKLTYIWDDEKNTFIKLAGFDKGITRDELHGFSGQSRQKQVLKRIIYGDNEISVPVKSVLTLIALEALTPFYIFQLFSLIVWIVELYLYYTIAIIIMSVVGITTSVIQTRKNQKNLKGTVHSQDTAIVCRGNGNFEQIPTVELVPGDVIVIPSNGCNMQCDAVLLSGNCVVNESMLTGKQLNIIVSDEALTQLFLGESVPITKNPLPNNIKPYNVKEDVSHTLFCGTKVIQTRVKGDEQVLAVVIRTGYLTTKGELVRSILYPPPADFKFESDSYKFIGILAFIAVLGIIYTIVSKSTRNISPLDILIKSLDLITIAVPPALPAAMTVGKLYALNRLKNSKIFCINSRVINVSGSIDCVCFDKTGTLTEDELDMWGIVGVEGDKIKQPLKDPTTLPNTSSLLRGMATCHSLSIIDNVLCGDPLDIKMFESTGWSLADFYDSSNEGINATDPHHIVVRPKTDPHEINFEIGIVRQFQFSSHLQRMSVIARASGTDTFTVYCKGSPEMVSSLSTSSSVPDDILTRLKDYTGQGYRVIALAERQLQGYTLEEVMKLHREDVERDLELMGLIVLENRLKPQTTGVIRTLKEANLKVVMITGDNIQTALHVARECQMVDNDETIIEVNAREATKLEAATISYHVSSQPSLNCNGNGLDVEKLPLRKYCFAITGNSWGNVVDYFPELVPKIVAKGVVFARMSGMQKQQLIEEFKGLGYYVAMCGDGANDCGALKAAHVGISLSEAESSVASPFTSKEPNISCIPKVIKEGRAALVTSFGVFKLMLCYSLTEFASVIILYNIDANLTSMQFLFIDICLILNFASFFGITKAYETLDKVPPMTSLMGFIPISSMVLFMLVTVVYQVVGYNYIQTFDWFVPFVFDENDDKNFLSSENYAVYTISMFQYITMAIVFSKGKPYRKPLYTNGYLTLSLMLMTVVCAYITVYPAKWVTDVLELQVPPALDGRYAMLIIALVSFASSIIAEDFLVEYVLKRVVAPKFRSVDRTKQKFLRVLRDLNEESSWPRLGEEAVSVTSISEKESNGLVNKGFVGSQDILITRC
ncbi:hypothetical protein NQ318_005789 [Aromia moschata]|uniref:Cation-transporting ATPase n=1 Tax=Aromia moschata TaxID=1265417 RepID=A0AAV8YS22_9CUCU|nr:hypothetical protein NQ318_005789 [Aromia moschata]